ncbi:hypothetical protein ACJJTC_015964 [Scirpophaga incertulas]
MKIKRESIKEIMNNKKKRAEFIKYINKIALRTAKRNADRHARRPRAPVLSQLHPQKYQQKGTPEDQDVTAVCCRRQYNVAAHTPPNDNAPPCPSCNPAGYGGYERLTTGLRHDYEPSCANRLAPPPQSQDSGDRITAQTPSTPAPFPGSPSSEDPASEGEFIPPNVNSNTLLVTPAPGPSGTTTTTLKIDTRPTRKSSGLHVGTPDIALKISRQIQRKKLTAGALRRAASIRHAQHTARDLSADNTRNLEDVAHQGTHTDTDRPTDTTDTEATPPPLPLTPPPTLTPTPAKNDQYYIVLSNTTSDDNQEGDHTPQESEDEWTTDAESVDGGRQSILPPSRGRTGVLKDLATERAREYYQTAKSAIEESKTLKRELRPIAVENLSHLYELVLSLADSRHRHRANLEVERTRSARERVRLLSAQQKELEALTASHRKELKETIQELRLDREAVIGLQKMMEGGMGTIIEAITKQQETRQPESEQQPQPTRETGRAEMGDALRDIKTQLSAIAGEMSLISAREESDSQIKLLEGARSLSKKETGQEPTLHSEIHTHLKRIVDRT